MSMSGRKPGSAKSISLASRQRRFRTFGLEPDQSGFTSSSSCSTILPQSVLRNLNRPVSAMILSRCVAGLHGNGQGFVTFHVRVAHRDRTASVVRAGQPDLPPLVDERVAAAALDPLQPDEMLSGLDRVPSEPALPRLAMEPSAIPSCAASRIGLGLPNAIGGQRIRLSLGSAYVISGRLRERAKSYCKGQWRPQHFLNFLPEPQKQGSLRPTLVPPSPSWRVCLKKPLMLRTAAGINSAACSIRAFTFSLFSGLSGEFPCASVRW